MTAKYITILSVLMVLSLVFTGSATEIHDSSGREPLLKDVTGQQLQDIIHSYQGKKAVLINVWATWCGPCVEEFPEIVKIQRKYQNRLRVIFVSADFPDSRDRALAFLKEQNVDWTTYFKAEKDEPFIKALSENWSGALPFTKILDMQGNLVSSWENSADFSRFETHVKQAIKTQ